MALKNNNLFLTYIDVEYYNYFMGGVSSVKGIILDFKNDDKNGLMVGDNGDIFKYVP